MERKWILTKNNKKGQEADDTLQKLLWIQEHYYRYHGCRMQTKNLLWVQDED